MRLSALGPLFALSPALFACSTATLREQVGRLEHEVARLQSREDRLEERLDAVELSQHEMHARASEPATEPVRNELAVVRVDPEALAPATLLEVEADAPEGNPRADASAAYQAALDLVKARRYDEAEQDLAGFLARYPNHPHADNALYWSGECSYARGDYRGAVHRFRELVERYPAGNKVPDALLKLGMSQRELGDEKAARQSFALLRRNYPTTEAAQRFGSGR
jgi:tol-pal system protein YbgF